MQHGSGGREEQGATGPGGSARPTQNPCRATTPCSRCGRLRPCIHHYSCPPFPCTYPANPGATHPNAGSCSPQQGATRHSRRPGPGGPGASAPGHLRLPVRIPAQHHGQRPSLGQRPGAHRRVSLPPAAPPGRGWVRHPGLPSPTLKEQGSPAAGAARRSRAGAEVVPRGTALGFMAEAAAAAALAATPPGRVACAATPCPQAAATGKGWDA